MTADSPADRARRARRHKRGDHSLCKPERRCQAHEQAEIAEAAAAQAERGPEQTRGARGQALWDAMESGLGPAHRLLLDEACRMADRLDRLDAALEDKGTWLRFEMSDSAEVVVIVDGVLAEYRQQVATLRALVAELRAVMPKAGQGKGPGTNEPEKPKGGLSDLTSRIAARRGLPAG